MRKILVVAVGCVLAAVAHPAVAACTASPPDAYLYIGWPNDGEVLSANKLFKVWFGLRNMGVAPKGVDKPRTGHHHLLIDADLPPLAEEIPSDRQYIHFGAGQTETMVELPRGTHTLQLLMGDHNHVPHCPPVYSRKITVQVK
jgi:hypothetical protein